MVGMRLVKLSKVPIKVEGKYGAIIIDPSDKYITIQTLPDTGCQSRITIVGHIESHELEGHKIILEKRD